MFVVFFLSSGDQKKLLSELSLYVHSEEESYGEEPEDTG